VPIVRATGGLVDTVFEGGPNDNGYVFPGTFRRMDKQEDVGARRQNRDEFYDTLKRAVRDYDQRPYVFWRKIENGMRTDNSWTLRQRDYLKVYAWLNDQVKDRAQGQAASPTGGIDLTPEGMNLETHGSATVFKGDWGSEGLKLNGLRPTIISVEPVADLSSFLGGSPIPAGQSH
jgi:hypothetical protein